MEYMNQWFPFSDVMPLGVFIFFIALLSVWTLFWKGLALWKAARLSHKYWFIALLVINTVGILEILYYFFFSKRGEKKDEHPE